MANPMYGQNKADDNLSSITANYLDYLAGNQANLDTGATVTDTEADADASSSSAATIAATTLVPNALNFLEHDGGAAGSVYLPQAVKDTHICMEITGDIDQTGALTIFTRGAVNAGTAVVFAKQVVGVPNGATGTSIETLGTAAAPTSIKLIWTAAAANTNQWGPGTTIHFYAPVADQWLVTVYPISDGTGATGALTTSAS